MLSEAGGGPRRPRGLRVGTRALSFSSAMRKARELGRRSLSLATVRPEMVRPRARHGARPHEAVLVLQRGETATSAYYFRTRTQDERAVYADLDYDPTGCALLFDESVGALLVVISRYIAPAWLDALEAAGHRVSRVAFFMDDDLPAMMADEDLPAAARGKVAAHYGRHVERLSGLCSEVWVSTPALAARHAEASPLILPPLPEAPPPQPAPACERRVVYHGADVHPRERAFVLEVARRLATLAPGAIVEITGDAALRRAAAAAPNVEVVGQAPWLEYLDRQRGRAAAVSLAPLYPSPVNDARSPVKAFDAARLGAAGLFTDAPAYRDWVRDGVDGLLVPMDPAVWAETIAKLLAAPERRMALAGAARVRLEALNRGRHALPPAPEA